MTKIDKITTTSYSHIGLTNGDKYFYVVTAVKSGGESKASVEVLCHADAARTGGTDEYGSDEWGHAGATVVVAVLDATSYNVYWSKSAGVAAGGVGVTKIPGVVATSFASTPV